MDPVTASIGGGLIAGAGGIASGIMNSNSNRDANRENIAFQREVNQRNEYLSNTAYVRASTDMKNAGLNPAMMFGSGSAASSGGQSAATIASEQEGEALARGAASAQQALQTKMALDQNDADLVLKEANARAVEEGIRLTEANAKRTNEEIGKIRQEISNLRSGKANTDASTRRTDLETSNLALTQPAVAAEASSRSARAKVETDNVWWDKKMDQLSDIINNASSVGALLSGRSWLQNHKPTTKYPDGSIRHDGVDYGPIYNKDRRQQRKR